MQRSDFLNTFGAIAATALVGAAPAPASIAGIAIPDSTLAKEATALAQAAEPVEIFNHSLRTFLFAELIAKATNVQHDTEAVYVASILHDAGLTPAYMSAHDRFEVDGANLARQVLSRHGIAGTRADLVWDAVSLHDNGGIARWKQPEVMLVNAGVGADFGGHLDVMQRADVIAVLGAAPRTGFVPVFLDAVATVVKKKPLATGGSFVTDVGYRMVPGFHLDNFCDDVKDDPFAGYTH
jgi:HD domain